MKTRLISILLVALLLVGCFSAFVSCDGEVETQAPTEKVTEAITEAPETDAATDAPETAAPETAAPETAAPETATPETDAPTTEAPTAEPETEAPVTEAETPAATEPVTEEPTEPETEGETLPQGPAEPLCETCEFKSVKGYPTCKVCGYIAPCYGVHGYTSDLEGHWKPECEHCGKAAGKSQNHEYEEKVVDEGDLLVYSFRCTICKFKAYEQEVPYEINSFYSAGDLSYTDMSGSLSSRFGFESGVGYASYSSENGGKSTVIVVSNGEVGDSSGRYLVMKVRLPSSRSSFSLNIKSVGADGQQTLTFTGLKATWTTIIVDVTKAVSVKATTDADTGITKDMVYGYSDMNGEYFLGDLRFVADAGPGESFDVAYVMMCETLEDAENFTKDEKTRIVYNDILNEKPEVDEGVCVDENGNPIIHEYIINDDGTHTLEKSCHQCGLSAVSHEPHSYGQTINENGDYTYACGACGHSKYGVDVNKYIDTEWINTAGITYYKMNKLGITEDEAGFDYASFSGQSTTAQIIYARTGFSEIEKAAAFPVGKANMFIIRMRTNTPAVSFGIQFGTPDAKASLFQFPTAVAGTEWATYVVDLAALIPGSYVADANGEYMVQNFYFHIGGTDFTSEVIYDVDFMAFVDEWEEIGVLTPDENVINVTNANVGGWVTTEGKQCVEGAHSFGVIQEDGKHLVKCGSCGYVQKEYNVPSAKTFYPAEVLAGIGKMYGAADRELIVEDGGASFVRLDNMKTNGKEAGNWMGWEIFASSTGYDLGRYMVIKIRIGNNGLGQSFFKFYTGTKQGIETEGQSISFKVTEDDQWHTVVIDLHTRISKPDDYMVPNSSGKYMIKALQLRPFSNNQPGAQPDDYMDVEYIAFCDDLGDIKGIIAEDQYEWSVDQSSSPIKNLDDGSCYNHSLSEVVDGETHTIKCSSCGNVIKEFTVSKDVNFYADLGAMNHFNSTLSKHLYDDENNEVFNRYEGAVNAHLNLTGGGGAGTWTKVKYQTGKYMVIKYRTNGGNFSLYISTKDNGNSKEFPDDLTRPEYSQVAVKAAAAGEGSWAVALIEITSEMAQYTTNSEQEIGIMISASGTYCIDFAYVAIVDSEDEAKTLLEEGESFEIGWKTQSGGNAGGNEGDEGGNEGGEQGGTTPTPPPAESEHTITESVSDGENGAKVYTYTCSHCDMNVVKTIPASVNGYFSADKLALRAPSYYQLGSHKIEADEEAFVRFIGADMISQALWLRAQADCDNSTLTGSIENEAPIDIGESKYMVIRARTNNPAHAFKVFISTTGHNSPTAVSVSGTEGKYNITGGELKAGDTYATDAGYNSVVIPLSASGANEWAVYVVDLSVVLADFFVKDGATETYILDTFFFHFDSFAASTALDISLVGFVAEWDDVAANVTEGQIVKVRNMTGGYSFVNTADGNCVTHAPEAFVVDGEYVAKCGSCGVQLADYNVKAEALGGFISAEELVSGGRVVGSFDREYMIEDGVSFVRIDNSKTNGQENGNWTGFTVVGTQGESHVGRYMVIKFRVGENGLSQSLLEFYASTQKDALTSSTYVAVKASEDGEWHTVVVDLSTRIAKPDEYFVAEDGVYNVRYLQIRPFSGAQDKAEADDYMDISYIGFFDSLDSVQDIVGESYELSVSASEHTVVNTVEK